MRALLTCLLIAGAGPVPAMNGEGHDDCMEDLVPALACRDATPEDRNPCEQIPMVRPDCRARAEEREFGR